MGLSPFSRRSHDYEYNPSKHQSEFRPSFPRAVCLNSGGETSTSSSTSSETTSISLKAAFPSSLWGPTRVAPPGLPQTNNSNCKRRPTKTAHPPQNIFLQPKMLSPGLERILITRSLLPRSSNFQRMGCLSPVLLVRTPRPPHEVLGGTTPSLAHFLPPWHQNDS